ncbi:hypothetical protein [Mesorhizobium sp.]|uniref:hypothetical protein n=1 Tax=Mesorhizobium sp. TaxID=1871066 RepID=UPI000FE4C3D0|nr:hypothetical protein [Mesorhizobium sp.]RWN60187.1 MAG: hypothetical protein EOS00_16725 [Mesorhizobium sp.]
MSYSSELSRRLRKKPPTTAGCHIPEPQGPDFKVVVPPHPQKYPNHQGSKGSVFGGICNRTACDRLHAEFYNRGTYGYYCAEDAIGINRYSVKTPLCIEVDHDLTHEEMDAHYRRMMEDMR